MYLSREQLERNLATLDSDTLRLRLGSGELTKDAQEVATAELARRAREGDTPRDFSDAPPIPSAFSSTPPPPPQGGGLARTLLTILLVFYVVMVLACAVVVVADPPWTSASRGGWSGMLGMLASLAAGFPWSFVLLPRVAAILGPESLFALCWACVPANLMLIVWLRRQAA